MLRAVTPLFATLAWCGVLVGCAAAAPIGPLSSAQQSEAEAPTEATRSNFAGTIASPQPDLEPHAEPGSQALRAACGASDAALFQVARHLAEHAGEADAFDVDELGYDLRAAGAPYVWPRAWRFDGNEGELEDAEARMRRWLSGFGDGGMRRCGVALLRRPDARLTIGVVAVDVLADLEPTPTRVRVGQWVSLRATLRVPADAAKLVVLGPVGAPFTVPTTLGGARVQARFHADREGTWRVQLLAAVDGGPRPLLEALIFAGVEPPSEFVVPRAPGEEAAQSIKDPRIALYGMVNAARTSEHMPELERDGRLEALAQAHAEAMRHAHKTAHDAGDGDLNQRLAKAGLEIAAGENVAHAASAALSHRELWASPSHRENLLFRNFERVGIGVAPDTDGTLWVCEVFAPSK